MLEIVLLIIMSLGFFILAVAGSVHYIFYFNINVRR